MKLRQLKKRRVARLRHRVFMARVAALRLEWERAMKQAMDDVTGALVEALMAPRNRMAAALAEGRAWVQQWAAEGYPGIQVTDTEQRLEQMEQQEARDANQA